jgi:hypothetical protein
VSTDAVDVARRLGAAHPEAPLPCPVCAASVKGANLDGHLRKVHAEMPPPPATRGFTLDGDRAVLVRWLGLSRRIVALPCPVEIGARTGRRPDAVMASYADDMNVAAETVKVGRYLRLAGDRAITIGCAGNTGMTRHWRGWRDGGPARRCDLVVGREAMVAIEYALAARGMLLPAG